MEPQLISLLVTVTVTVLKFVLSTESVSSIREEIKEDKLNGIKIELDSAKKALKQSVPNLSTAAIYFFRTRQYLKNFITTYRKVSYAEKARFGAYTGFTDNLMHSDPKDVGLFILSPPTYLLSSALTGVLNKDIEYVPTYPLKLRNWAAYLATKCYFAECILNKYNGDNAIETFYSFKKDFVAFQVLKCNLSDYMNKEKAVPNPYADLVIKEVRHTVLYGLLPTESGSNIRECDLNTILHHLTNIAIRDNIIPFWDYAYSDTSFGHERWASIHDEDGIDANLYYTNIPALTERTTQHFK
jgi:hypothetical protein